MTVRWLTAFLDRPHATFETAIQFWMQVTGTKLSPTRGEHDQFATLQPPDGDAFLRVQRIVEGAGGCHVDLHVDDIAGTAARAVSIGAREQYALDDVTVMRSPAGLAFCVVHHRGESTRPRPPAVAGIGTRTVVDQVCIDVAPDDYERECAFWAELTGWERRPARLSEFSYLVHPAGMPFRLLFQRLVDANDGQPATAHCDLACDDRDAAATLHHELGARHGARYEYWTTMADPSGLPYCLTRRHPETGVLAPPVDGVTDST